LDSPGHTKNNTSHCLSCSELPREEGIDRTHGKIVPTESDLLSLYYFPNTPEDEPVEWDDRDLKYGAMPPERPWDASLPDTTNDQRVKSPPTVHKASNFGNNITSMVSRRTHYLFLIDVQEKEEKKNKQTTHRAK
jgi:hypothetical protein